MEERKNKSEVVRSRSTRPLMRHRLFRSRARKPQTSSAPEILKSPLRNAYRTPLFPPVVTQYYEAEVVSEYVIRGNAAILKCTIPSFVAEFVSVDSWVGGDGSTFKPSNDYGTTLLNPALFFCLLRPRPYSSSPSSRVAILDSISVNAESLEAPSLSLHRAPPYPAELGKSSKWHVVTIRFRRGPVWRQLYGGGNATG